MGYLDTIKWDTIKRLAERPDQGLVAVKKGALIARKKAGELTEEGKRQYKLFTLKTKVHKGISDLGARVYALMGSRAKNPALDAKVKDIVGQVKRLESQIAGIEQRRGAASRRKIKRG